MGVNAYLRFFFLIEKREWFFVGVREIFRRENLKRAERVKIISQIK
jgi:hypothetical protein